MIVENKVTILTNSDALDLAFSAVSKNNLFALRPLLDNNTLLQAKNNQGDTLLHAAVELNNYYLTEFLIIRGVNLTARNDRDETAFAISEETGNTDISRLLKSARSSIK